MIRWQVQGFEVVIVSLNFRTAFNVKAEAAEHGADFLHGQGNGMDGSLPRGTSGQSRIKTFERLLLFGVLKGLETGVNELGDAAFHIVGKLAGLGSVSGIELRNKTHEFGQPALATEKVHAQVFELF